MRHFHPPIPRWIARCAGWLLLLGAATAAPVDFNRDIRPLLSDHCYACHGPDENKRKAGLRLDRKDDAFRALKSGHHALIPRDPTNSTLIARIRASDPDDLMPPADTGKPLTEAQRALLERWVSEGAPWQEHWSFVPPRRPELPAVRDTAWARNELDRFVLARLEAAGLRPNPEADRATLLRRVTLDLTGLPPSIEEMDAFLADERPDAYEQAVDRLLGLPQYGERMAAHWMDLARFADTSGYHFDGVRFMWLWRDWVIRAFNENLPYDRFTVEQLAGDLLPHPTQSQRVATGFVRNNMTNDEGGADPDEYLNKYVVDRVNTLGAVWLGMTVGCTECHDHKYDPMSTREFYQLYAFFHNVPEKGLDRIRTDNPPPRLPVPTPEQALQLVEAEFTLKDAEKTLQDRANELGETQEKWERELIERPPTAPEALAKALRLPLDGNLAWAATASMESVLSVPSVPSTNTPSPTGGTLRLDTGPEFVEGRLGKALKLDGRTHVDLGPAFGFDRTNAASFGGWIRFQGNGAILSRMEKGPGLRGFDIFLSEGRAEVHLVNTWPDNALKVRTRDPMAANQWQHLWVTYDGAGKASGVKIYVNGRRRGLETQKDQLSESIATAEPLRLGSRHGDANLQATLDDWRFLDHEATEAEIRDQLLADFFPIVQRSRGQRTDEERADLARFYRESHAVDYLRSESALAAARQRKEKLMSEIPTTLVMEEMDPPRPTFILTRGDFRNRGERVTAGTPGFLPPLPDGPVNRLTLARWLVAPEHPLMARVTVNRLWALFFGTGLVKTANDFGSQGEWPSHPELLDWMAVQFRVGDAADATPTPGAGAGSGSWDVKGMIRSIVTSAAYRQSAHVSPEKQERDPYNRLISRGPRLRLDAEFIRDNALSIAGLLNPVIGGPSVKPYQPAGIWDGTDSVYTQDKGDLLYRRGLYVFWRRSAHYPPLATFDAPNREVCTFARQRTQTPLQSLVLMNDPGFVEAARGLAQRVLREEPTDLDRRILRAFRHALGRPPAARELEVLHGTYRRQLDRFQKDPDAADALLKVGESSVSEAMPKAELAAMTTVANVLLNLNETITK
ncbi:MAG: DUF1553 domain-containing protein [Verrucomicrobiae bacterium]|nr:DUF1553 domain-containing protein [Verrucomicrobiae bacterium]